MNKKEILEICKLPYDKFRSKLESLDSLDKESVIAEWLSSENATFYEVKPGDLVFSFMHQVWFKVLAVNLYTNLYYKYFLVDECTSYDSTGAFIEASNDVSETVVYYSGGYAPFGKFNYLWKESTTLDLNEKSKRTQATIFDKMYLETPISETLTRQCSPIVFMDENRIVVDLYSEGISRITFDWDGECKTICKIDHGSFIPVKGLNLFMYKLSKEYLEGLRKVLDEVGRIDYIRLALISKEIIQYLWRVTPDEIIVVNPSEDAKIGIEVDYLEPMRRAKRIFDKLNIGSYTAFNKYSV